jgi:hypothetical protein
MPKGPRGEKRRADVIGNAVKVMRIATGEEEEAPQTDNAAGPTALTIREVIATEAGKRGVGEFTACVAAFLQGSRHAELSCRLMAFDPSGPIIFAAFN